MKYWLYTEPATAFSSEPVYMIMSDKAILANYYDYWRGKMIGAHKQDLISEEACIQDWVTIHWAMEATEEVLLRIIKNGQ